MFGGAQNEVNDDGDERHVEAGDWTQASEEAVRQPLRDLHYAHCEPRHNVAQQVLLYRVAVENSDEREEREERVERTAPGKHETAANADREEVQHLQYNYIPTRTFCKF